MKDLIAIGVHTGVPMAEYHALPAWGSSSLRAMRRGPPARVQWERENQREDTDATTLGTAVHAAFLEPVVYLARYAHKPAGMNFSTKEGKAWRDAPERDGLTILSHDQGEVVDAICDALMAKLCVYESIANATHREVVLLWKDPGTGAACKARPDWIEGRYIYDLKTSRHAEGRSLAYRAYVEGWMHQLAHYRTGAQALGMDIRGGRLVVVTPKAPHFVYTLEVKPDALDMLELENLATIKAMQECVDRGEWDDTEERWVPVEPPPSALVEFGEMTFDGPEEEA